MSEWQPIETAPKDGTRVLLGYSHPPFTGIYAICGQWDKQESAPRPRPYWRHEMSFSGTVAMRKNTPTHWMPLPPPPTEDKR